MLEINITGLTKEGAGVGRHNGEVYFVKGALPGENVRVQVIKQAKNYKVARLEQVLLPSPNRAQPPCTYFKACGGCTLQHLSYPAQLQIKAAETGEVLRRISGLPLEVAGISGLERPFAYRNKALYPVGQNSRGEIEIGFYRPRSHDIVDMAYCAIQQPGDKQIIALVRAYMRENGVLPYNEKTGRGCVRHIMTRYSRAEGTCMAVLVVKHKPKNIELLVNALRALPGMESIQLNFNTRPDNIVLGNTCELLWGQPVIYDRLMGIRFPISPLSFAQVNPVMAEKLYTHVCDLAGEVEGGVVDAYAGIGVMTMALARRAQWAAGIEIVPEAVADARACAQEAKVENVRFVLGDAANWQTTIPENPVLLVLDPPRAGIDAAVAKAAVHAAVPRIIYVSCDPATLARDLALLHSLGYTPGPVHLFDMFAQSGHVETVVLMSRVDK